MNNLSIWLNLKKLRYGEDPVVFVNQAKMYIEDRLVEVLSNSGVNPNDFEKLSMAIRMHENILPLGIKQNLSAVLSLLDQFSDMDFASKNFGFDDLRPIPDLKTLMRKEEKNFDIVLDLLKPEK